MAGKRTPVDAWKPSADDFGPNGAAVAALLEGVAEVSNATVMAASRVHVPGDQVAMVLAWQRCGGYEFDRTKFQNVVSAGYSLANRRVRSVPEGYDLSDTGAFRFGQMVVAAALAEFGGAILTAAERESLAGPWRGALATGR